VLAGDLLLLASDVAFLAVLVGFALFLASLVALGVSLWRQAPPAHA
jgi:small basic protein